MKNIKFIPQYEPVVRLKYVYAVAKQMLSGWVGAGKTVELFEEEIKKITKRQHVISTTSGTMSLYLALSALNIPKDKKVIFPAYTFLAGANVIKHLGYEIEFLDVSVCDMQIQSEDLRNKLKSDKNIGCVVYVEHNGNVWNTVYISNICKEFGVKLIVDSAQSIGMWEAGSLGDISIFSFSVPKLITTGQGGVALTNDKTLAEKMRQLRDHGDNWRSTKIHNHIGLNLKFNDILAAYGLAQLKDLDKLVKIRRNIAYEYGKYIKLEGISPMEESGWMMIYRTDKADEIITALKSQSIQAVKYYRSIPSNPAFGIKERFTNAEYIHDHCLYLPSSLNLKPDDIKKVCQIIAEVEK